MLKVTLPDGKTLEYSRHVRPIDIAAQIGPRLAKATLAAEVDGRLMGANEPLPADGQVALRLITSKDAQALDLFRHSCAHVMARAVMRLWDGVQLAFGPTVAGGFYYDFQMEHALSEADFPQIEAEMARIVKEDEPFERVEMDRQEAIQFCRDLKQSLKVEHLADGLAEEPTVSFYRQGEFVDLCRGPHVPSAGAIGAVKLLSVAGAYWKGDASRQQLQRLYGTAFFTKQELDEHLRQLEEAKRRDHRVLGKQLELFLIEPAVGQGLVFWLPKGAAVRRELENFLYDELIRRGYQPVYTPVIGNVHLYETSGHYPYYKDAQFPPIEMQDGDRYLLRPMNCPHHVTIYQSKPRSYRDLPLRLAEFGTVHRFEQSGELNGMTRVRGFTQDDAHIFCTEEQVADEFRGCIEMTQFVLQDARAGRLPRAAGVPRSGEREVRGQRGDVAAGRGVAGRRLPRDGPARHARRAGRGRLLRPEGRFRRGRLHRPPLAAWHRAARLQSAQRAAFRPGIHRRRQRAAPAGDDPPRAVRLVRAVRGHVDRAFCRGVPSVARAGAGAGDGRQPKGRGVRPRRPTATVRGRPAGHAATTGRKKSGPKSAMPNWN